jgi:hypothetical protein
VNNERDTEDTQKGNPPGLVLSGIFPSGQGDTGAVAEEVDTQANKSSSTSEPPVPKKNVPRESGPDHGATSEPTADLGSQRISPSSTPPPSSSAPRTPSKAVQNTDSSRPSSIRQGKEDSSSRQRQGDEEEDRPSEPAFDFQGFLVQLRSRQAEPIQKYLKRYVLLAFDTTRRPRGCATRRVDVLTVCCLFSCCDLVSWSRSRNGLLLSTIRSSSFTISSR